MANEKWKFVKYSTPIFIWNKENEKDSNNDARTPYVWKIFGRFLEDFQIFGIFSDFWTILGLVTFETLITILTIENLNSWQSLLSDN